MIDRERLGAISELGDSRRRTDGAAPDIEKLARFIDGFPVLEKELRAALREKDLDALSKGAAAVRDMLVRIQADEMAEKCLEKIGEFKTMDAGSLEAYLEGFLSDVSSLSIDIQMAVYGGEKAAPRPSAGRQATILAVDDNAFFLNTLKACLQDSGHKLFGVTSGSVALRFLEERVPDLFILDIDMPDMDGYELAGKIRAKGREAPIIFLTGNASKEYVMRAIEAGAADFIVKPIDKKRTLGKIAKYV